jgi:hypothetical protein
MIHPSKHNGGDVYGGVVGTDGSTVIFPLVKNLRYRIMQADIANTGPIFIRLHPDEPAILGEGIVLWPGDFHEILYSSNWYEGNIRAISASGTEKFYGHDGR